MLRRALLPFLLLATGGAEPITPEQGLSAIEAALASDQSEIRLAAGLFLLPEALVISAEASGKKLVGAGERTVLSGAVEAGPWEEVDESRGLWRCASPLNDGRPVRQLFQFGEGRLPRSRIPNEGWFRGDKLSTIDFDVNRVATRDVANEWRTTRPWVFAGLRYREEDSEQIREVAADSAILQTISAWTSAWQPVRSLDSETRDIQFFTPSRYPLAHWSYGVNEGGGTPYAIENTDAGVDLPGEWYWNPKDDSLSLKFDSDPNDFRILVPALETVVRIESVKNLVISHLQVAHSRTLFGRYDQHRDWHGAVQAWDSTFPDEYPEGLTVPQSAPFTGEAVHISNASRVVLENCTITGTGGYAIRLSSNSHQCIVRNCNLMQLGAGGVNIDPEIRQNESDYPTQNTVEGCSIRFGGRLHPAACAIRIAEAADNRILDNRISHFGYTGITVGWAWNPRPNRTTGNRIQGNEISFVMEVLSDGAGIYTLGSIPGTRVEDNFIHDVVRADTAIGAGNSGVFFDQYSRGAVVRNNRLERIQSWHGRDQREPHPFKHHRNLPSDHTFEGNTVDGIPFVPAPDSE